MVADEYSNAHFGKQVLLPHKIAAGYSPHKPKIFQNRRKIRHKALDLGAAKGIDERKTETTEGRESCLFWQ